MWSFTAFHKVGSVIIRFSRTFGFVVALVFERDFQLHLCPRLQHEMRLGGWPPSQDHVKLIEPLDCLSTFSGCMTVGETKLVKCPTDHVIDVTAAFYGRLDRKTCPKEGALFDTSCSLAEAIHIVQSNCQHQRTITIRVTV